jgi:7,8-dihydropterin-6-yl-methyl-4-(beta-D-ribofuranosyl)aminobenzene 5'-phosphate synthase
MPEKEEHSRMKIKFTTLAENTASYLGFLGEWGWSILIEVGNTKILLDTGGPSGTAVHNALKLGINLSSIDKIVLSHGHADHTGGLREMLTMMRKKVEIIAHPDIWAAKYRKTKDSSFYIGIPFQRRELESLGASFTLSSEPVRLTDNVTTTGEIPMVTDYEQLEPAQVVMENGDFKQDPLLDDLAIVIKNNSALEVITGCAHHGIINTLYRAQQLTGLNSINTVLGGTHLYRASEERIDNTIAEIKKLKVKKLGVSHCTGFHASSRLAEAFNDAFLVNNAGTCLILSG